MKCIPDCRRLVSIAIEKTNKYFGIKAFKKNVFFIFLKNLQ